MSEGNKFLVDELRREGYLKSQSLIAAFREIDRKDFVPKALWPEAYENYPLPIGEGQTISQPLTVAFMIELLAPRPGEKVLDVGFGSGWTTALLAYIVSGIKDQGSRGRVVAIERIQKLCKFGETNVRKYFKAEERVKFFCGDAAAGLEKEAPFDKIFSSASAESIPEAWKGELKIGGRIVAPVLTSIIVLDKISEKEFETKEYFGFSFVPLIKD